MPKRDDYPTDLDFYRAVDEWLNERPSNLSLWAMPIFGGLVSLWDAAWLLNGGNRWVFGTLLVVNSVVAVLNFTVSARRLARWEKRQSERASRGLP
jgi:hypothetical protein